MTTYTRQQKQKYLRDQISQDHYDDFFQFCQQNTQQVNIDAWDMVFIKSLVLKFWQHQQKQRIKNEDLQSQYHNKNSSNGVKNNSYNNNQNDYENYDTMSRHSTISLHDYQTGKIVTGFSLSNNLSKNNNDNKINGMKKKPFEQFPSVDLKQSISKISSKSKANQGNAISILNSLSYTGQNDISETQNRQKSKSTHQYEKINQVQQQKQQLNEAKFKANKSISINHKQISFADFSSFVPMESNQQKKMSKSHNLNNQIKTNLQKNMEAEQRINEERQKKKKIQQQQLQKAQHQKERIQKRHRQAQMYYEEERKIRANVWKTHQQYNNPQNKFAKQNIYQIPQQTHKNKQQTTYHYMQKHEIPKKITQQKHQESQISLSDMTGLQSSKVSSITQKSSRIQIKQVRQLNKNQIQKINNKLHKNQNISKISNQELLFYNKNKLKQIIECKQTIQKPYSNKHSLELNNPNLEFKVQQGEIIKRSFISANYMMYNVKVLPYRLQLKRNDQDFQKLRKALLKFYPGLIIPYLQTSPQLFEGQLSGQYIKRHIKNLQLFMNNLIRHPEIRNCKIFEDFLSLEGHKLIKRKFQQYQSTVQKPASLQQLCTLSGFVTIKISEEQRLYQLKLKSFQQKYTNFISRFTKLQTLKKEHFESIQDIESKLLQLVSSFEKTIKQFNDRLVKQDEIHKLSQAMKLLYKNYSRDFQNSKHKIQLLNSSILPFLKYQEENIESIEQLRNVKKDLLNEFLQKFKKKNNLSLYEEQKDYLSKKLKSKKNGIVESSKSLIVMKYHIGYLNHILCQQTKRFFNQFGQKVILRWGKMLQLKSQYDKQSVKIWDQLGNQYLNQLVETIVFPI